MARPLRNRLFWPAFLSTLLGITGTAYFLGLRDWPMLATFVAALLVAYYLARHAANKILHPILTLSRHAKDIALGRTQRSTLVPPENEIGDLINNFNEAISSLTSENQVLSAEQRQLEAVLGAISSGVLIINASGQVQRVNKSALGLLDINQQQAIGGSVASVLRHYRLIELWEECRQQNSEVTAALEFQRKGQSNFWQVSITPFTSREPNYLILVQDLSEIHRLQMVRRDFISNISHELRTPIASLKALVNTLQDGAMEDLEMAARFLDRAEVEVDSMGQMVEELQELARIESGQVPLKIQTISVADLVLPALDRLLSQARWAKLELIADLPARLPPVEVDPRRASQILTNLIHNAIKFTPPGGRIIVRARKKKEMLQLQVQDNGIGIPSADLDRIFERFYKTDRARSGGGTGLGLAIARHLVEAHGGEIWARSKERKGSTFYFSLPLAGDYAMNQASMSPTKKDLL